MIIFDCDGVLVDSEVIACAVEAEELTRAGFPWTTEEIARAFIGRRAADVYAAVEAKAARKLPADFPQTLMAATLGRFRTELKPIPHVADALASLREPTCVASSSTPERIRLSLDLTGLARFFGGNLFSATEVAHGKPAPDLFLHAASRMGIEPRHCIVVEDSLSGVQAAVAARMTTIGFVGGSHAGPELGAALEAAGARAIVADMRRLPAAIAELR